MSYRATLPRLCLLAALLASGCRRKADDSSGFRNALDSFYAEHPVCLWSEPVKLPLPVNTVDPGKAAAFNVLVDQGLLVRSIAGKPPIESYDLSAQGHTAWTADPVMPESGNLCYGHRKVTSLESSTPTNDEPGASSRVRYHYDIVDVPAWASAGAVQSLFPGVRTNLAGPGSDEETLTKTDSGWTLLKPILIPNSSPTNTPIDKTVQ
ncbi:MAG TPA: hypothetical protein VGC07_06570 [Granulicella sp.]